MLIKDRMTTDVITVRPETDVEEAHDLMKKNNFRRLPVVDTDGAIIGIVTDRDLRQVLIPLLAGESLIERVRKGTEVLKPSREEKKFYYVASDSTVGDIMTKEVITVRPDDDLLESARLIIKQKIGGLPVVNDEGKVVGMMTEMDFFAALIDMLSPSAFPTDQA